MATTIPTSFTLSPAAEQLPARVADVDRQARWMRRMRGWAGCLQFGLWLAAGFVLVDHLVRIQDGGVRWMLSLTALAAPALAASRVWWQTRRPLEPGAVARHIERRFPELRHRLSSSLDFLEGESACNSGSTDLQQHVVERTWEDARDLDFRDCLDGAAMRRSLWAAAVCVGLLTVAAFSKPATALTGMQRLMQPWAGPIWPRQNQLQYVDPPSIVAKGESVFLRAIDVNQRLPDMGVVELLYNADQPTTPSRDAVRAEVESHRVSTQDDQIELQLRDVTRPFQYRIVAGDDALPWRKVSLVELPEIETWTMTIQHPRHLGSLTFDVDGSRSVLAGSTLNFRAVLSRSIEAARLEAESGQGWPLVVDDSQRQTRLSTPIQLNQTGVMRFRLMCREPEGQWRRLPLEPELSVVADTPPAIAWELPADDQAVTQRTMLPVRAIVNDNEGVASAHLLVKSHVVGTPQRVPLLGTATIGVQSEIPFRHRDADREASKRTLRVAMVDGVVPVAALGVRVGEACQLRIEARDAQPGDAGLAQTPWRTIRIVSQQQMMQLTGERQSEIFRRIEQLIRVQRNTWRRTTTALDSLERLNPAEARELIQSIELEQRRVQQTLGVRRAGDSSGLLGKVVETLDDLRLHGHGQKDQQQLENVKQVLRDVAGRQSDEAQRQLVEATREKRDKRRNALASAGDAQQALIGTLESLLADAAQWSNYREASQELLRVLSAQRGLLGDVESQQSMQLAGAGAKAQIRAAGASLSRRQLALGRRFDRLSAGLRQLSDVLTGRDRQVVLAGLEAASRLRISSAMRTAAESMESARFGRAADQQHELVVSLEQMLQQLSPTSANLRDALVQELRQLQQDVASVGAEQDGSDSGVRSAALAEQTRDLALRAQPNFPQAAESIGMAAIRLDQAADAEGARRRNYVETAAQRLRDALQQMDTAGDPRKSKAVLLVEQLKAAAARQVLLAELLERLAEADEPGWSELQRQQRDLVKELGECAEGWQAVSPIVEVSIRDVIPAMQAADAALARRNQKQAAAAMQIAARQLAAIEAAFEADQQSDSEPSRPNDNDTEPNRASGEPEAGQQGSQGVGLKVAELQMMLTMQQDVLARTAEFDSIKQRRVLSESEQAEQVELARRQGALSVWLRESMREGAATGASQPAKPKKSSIDELMESLQ